MSETYGSLLHAQSKSRKGLVTISVKVGRGVHGGYDTFYLNITPKRVKMMEKEGIKFKIHSEGKVRTKEVLNLIRSDRRYR